MEISHENSLENILAEQNSPQPLQTIEKSASKLTLKERKALRRTRQLIGKNKGRWNSYERRQYYIFLKIYSQFFVTKDHRRNDKVFRMMANFIKTRTPDQCRTHHQKLEFKHCKLTKIMESLKLQFGSIQYQQIIKKCEVASTTIDTPTNQKQRDSSFEMSEKMFFMMSCHDLHSPKISYVIPVDQSEFQNSKENIQIQDDNLNFNYDPPQSSMPHPNFD